MTREVHDERSASIFGIALGLSFLVCFLTGVWSHLQQHPPAWLPIPLGPAGLYRTTQGLHVITGLASIPLLLAELCSVSPQLLKRPVVRSPVHAVGWIVIRGGRRVGTDRRLAPGRAGIRTVMVTEQASTGESHEFAVTAWQSPATRAEREMLVGIPAAVLDIGCGPGRLLTRLRQLIAPDGVALVEVDPPGRFLVRDEMRLRCPRAGDGPFFEWAWVGADAISDLSGAAGFGDCELRWHDGNRFVAHLHAGGAW